MAVPEGRFDGSLARSAWARRTKPCPSRRDALMVAWHGLAWARRTKPCPSLSSDNYFSLSSDSYFSLVLGG
jgi:hypothetical protein